MTSVGVTLERKKPDIKLATVTNKINVINAKKKDLNHSLKSIFLKMGIRASCNLSLGF